MIRPFLIEEIMLGGVSGEVTGTVAFDIESGTIDNIQCEAFSFRREDIDDQVSLDRGQLTTVRSIVQRVLEDHRDLGHGSARIMVSAERYSPPQQASAGKKVLAEYLQSAGRPTRQQVRRAQ